MLRAIDDCIELCLVLLQHSPTVVGPGIVVAGVAHVLQARRNDQMLEVWVQARRPEIEFFRSRNSGVVITYSTPRKICGSPSPYVVP